MCVLRMTWSHLSKVICTVEVRLANGRKKKNPPINCRVEFRFLPTEEQTLTEGIMHLPGLKIKTPHSDFGR